MTGFCLYGMSIIVCDVCEYQQPRVWKHNVSNWLIIIIYASEEEILYENAYALYLNVRPMNYA